MNHMFRLAIFAVGAAVFLLCLSLDPHNNEHSIGQFPPRFRQGLNKSIVAEEARISAILQEFMGSFSNASAEQYTTSAKFTEFHITNCRHVYRINDILFVIIRAKDMHNRLKNRGGDFFRAKIYTEKTRSSAPGHVQDYGNGTYGVTFMLLWEGNVTISVRMVHSSSAISVLKRVAKQFPFNRSRYQRKYMSAKKSYVGWCSLDTKDLRVFYGSGICDFSDSHAGVQWYCQRLKDVPCNHSIYHRYSGFLKEDNELGLTEEEKEYFKRDKKSSHLFAAKKAIKGKISTIHVLGNSTEISGGEQLQSCRPGLPAPLPSGYYHNGQWVSRVCASKRLSLLEYKICLQNKVLDFLGDSTLRQWAELLGDHLSMQKKLSPYYKSITAGPEYFIDSKWNITVRYQSHGPPLRNTAWTNATVLSNMVRIIDSISGGQNSVVVLTLGAHFSNHPLAIFITRVQAVRLAVLRLLRRDPQTIVVVKTPNTSGASFNRVDEWPLYQMYLIMKEIFSHLSVVFVDAWEMTNCQFNKDSVHPAKDVIFEELYYLLSYVCD